MERIIRDHISAVQAIQAKSGEPGSQARIEATRLLAVEDLRYAKAVQAFFRQRGVVHA